MRYSLSHFSYLNQENLMNTLIKSQKHFKSKQNLIRHSTTLKKRVSYSILMGSLLMPSLIMAKSSNSSETKKLIEQMEEYKRQLDVTNQRLQELEKLEASRIVSNHNGNGNGLGETNGNGKNGNNNLIVSNTPTAEKRNVQDEPDVEDPVAAKVPKSRYLRGFYDNGFVLRTKDNRYSLGINGLVQGRYTLNLPNSNAGNDSQTFDLALGRLFFSGTVFDPNLSYFFFYQTSTLNDNNRVDTIDWWGKYQLGDVGIKAGRILPQYSRQFYTDIGK